MGTVHVERCQDCQALVGAGTLFEHQQKRCLARTLPGYQPLADRLRRHQRDLYGGGNMTELREDLGYAADILTNIASEKAIKR